MNKMRVNRFLVGLITLSLVSCATMQGDRTLNVTGDQIAQKLDEKLALPISLLNVFDISLSNSVVTFDKTSDRITTTMDTKLNSQLLNKSLDGKLGISGKLRFDATTNTVILDEPKIEDINFDGADSKFNHAFNAMAKTVGGEMLNGLTLYTVKAEDLTFGGTTYTPKDLQVTDSGLQLTLTPQRR